MNLLSNFRILLKGRPNTRKTVSYASFPGKHYIFLFDPDGTHPLIKHFPERVNSGEISWDYYHPGNLEMADAKMRQILEHNPYNNITIDSLTFGGQWSMDYGLAKASNLDKVGYVRMPGQREYGVEHNIMMAMIGAGLRLTNCNFFLTAHVSLKQTFGPDGKLLSSKQRLVSGGQSLAEKVLAAFKNVWHFEEVSNTVDPRAVPKYLVSTLSMGENIARNVIPNIPKEMDITNEFLYDVMQKALKGVKI